MSIESDILQITKQGKNVTHILTINIQGTESNKTTIIDFIYRCINDKGIIKSCHRKDMNVKWNTFDKINYYTDSLFYNDIVQLPCVNSNAIIFSQNKNYVMVYHDKCNIETRLVEPVGQFKDKSYIKSGLKPGEKVIIKLQLLVFNQMNQN